MKRRESDNVRSPTNWNKLEIVGKLKQLFRVDIIQQFSWNFLHSRKDFNWAVSSECWLPSCLSFPAWVCPPGVWEYFSGRGRRGQPVRHSWLSRGPTCRDRLGSQNRPGLNSTASSNFSSVSWRAEMFLIKVSQARGHSHLQAELNPSLFQLFSSLMSSFPYSDLASVQTLPKQNWSISLPDLQ